jgi:hypothetical protein
MKISILALASQAALGRKPPPSFFEPPPGPMLNRWAGVDRYAADIEPAASYCALRAASHDVQMLSSLPRQNACGLPQGGMT